MIRCKHEWTIDCLCASESTGQSWSAVFGIIAAGAVRRPNPRLPPPHHRFTTPPSLVSDVSDSSSRTTLQYLSAHYARALRCIHGNAPTRHLI